jgi:hypothetical protein
MNKPTEQTIMDRLVFEQSKCKDTECQVGYKLGKKRVNGAENAKRLF